VAFRVRTITEVASPLLMEASKTRGRRKVGGLAIESRDTVLQQGAETLAKSFCWARDRIEKACRS